MRAWRRGTKEMDLILGPYADGELAGMGATSLDLFDGLLEENDQDLYAWISGHQTPPEKFAGLLSVIGSHARSRIQP